MHLLVICSCPDRPCSEQIAKDLIAKKLAACVNIVPAVTSVYEWQGELNLDQENLLLIKSNSSLYPDLEKAISSQHPYELPEIIAVPIDQGLPEYLQWIDTCLATK